MSEQKNPQPSHAQVWYCSATTDFWHAYEHCCVPVTEQQFRDAYVYAERYVVQHHVILPADTFRETLEKKISLQLAFLSLPASYLSPLASYIYLAM
jgi:putative hydrolase of the HAD superfamily